MLAGGPPMHPMAVSPYGLGHDPLEQRMPSDDPVNSLVASKLDPFKERLPCIPLSKRLDKVCCQLCNGIGARQALKN